MKKIYYFIFITGIIFIILVPWYTKSLYQPCENIIKLSSFTVNGKADDLHFRILDDKDPDLFKIETSISKKRINKINADVYKLIINRFFCQRYKVYFNGHLIGSLGDIKNGQSNIWNTLGIFTIDPHLIKKDNKLVIEAYAEYELGTYTPILLTNTPTANKFYCWYNNIILSLNEIAIGFMILGASLMLMLFLKSGVKRLYLLFYFLSVVWAALHLIHSLTIPNLPMSLTSFKKMVLLPLYLSGSSLSFGAYYKFKKKWNLVFGGLLFVGFIFILFMQGSPFYQYNNYANVLFSLNLIGWLITYGIHFKSSAHAKFLFFGSLFLSLSLIYDIFLRESYADIHLTLVGIFLIAVSSCLIVIFEIITVQNRLVSQKKLTGELYKKAIKDGMTSTYNHTFITSVLKKDKRQFTIAVIDIDDFKQFNDEFGHQVGDNIIKFVAGKLKENTRKTDLVGRYGGDEFVLILYSCSKLDAKKIIPEIKQTVERTYKTSSGEKVNITVSIGVHVSPEKESGMEAFNKADQALYEVKTHGKDSIHFYNEK